MLVLNRKRGEAILLQTPNETIRLQIVDIQDNRIKLGIEAPTRVNIAREEIKDQRYIVQRRDPDGWPTYDQKAMAHRSKIEAMKALETIRLAVPGYEYRIVDQEGNVLEIEETASV